MYNGRMDTAYSSVATRGCRLERSTPFGFDPFHPPAAVTPLATIRARDRVAVAGVVEAVSCVEWDGGPVVEATIADATGSVVLAFVGRRYMPGIYLCRTLAAGGTVVVHRDRLIFMNPVLWLLADNAGTPSHIVGLT
jgi:hypothetical protein